MRLSEKHQQLPCCKAVSLLYLGTWLGLGILVWCSQLHTLHHTDFCSIVRERGHNWGLTLRANASPLVDDHEIALLKLLMGQGRTNGLT